ncbi:MAG: DmsE family decaheme c-type cytochrome [Acidobacteria bacterium]|nr:DmsE family decaheme c-type cytochrome [Acidobacteriota bacterium]
MKRSKEEVIRVGESRDGWLPPAGGKNDVLTSSSTRSAICSFFVAITFFIFTGAPRGQDQKQPEKVGNEICMSCHDMEPVFSRTAHAKQECENCHGPGSAHVEAGGDLSLSFKVKPAKLATSQCLSCHLQKLKPQTWDTAAFDRTAHARGGISCVSCHQIHPQRPNFGLMRSEERELCTSCHASTRSEFLKPYHHPVMEGAVKCTDCHTPHGEDTRPHRRLVVATEEACVSCHSDKKGPFVFEHAAIKINGCETCHQPHGSVNAKLLRRSEVHQLCLECHSRTQGVTGAQPPAFHDLRTARFRNCTICHREIHGSNASPIFFR